VTFKLTLCKNGWLIELPQTGGSKPFGSPEPPMAENLLVFESDEALAEWLMVHHANATFKPSKVLVSPPTLDEDGLPDFEEAIPGLAKKPDLPGEVPPNPYAPLLVKLGEEDPNA
jgi:hypothetical protein